LTNSSIVTTAECPREESVFDRDDILVQRILQELRRWGIHMLDVSPVNIAFRD
jgi:hypothetical protein